MRYARIVTIIITSLILTYIIDQIRRINILLKNYKSKNTTIFTTASVGFIMNFG